MSLLDKSVVLLPPYATKSIYTVVKEFEHKGTAKVRLRHPETGSEHAKPVSQIRIAEDAEIVAGHRIEPHEAFQEWFKTQPFYSDLLIQFGDAIFDFERVDQSYRKLPVNIAWITWQEKETKLKSLNLYFKNMHLKFLNMELDYKDELKQKLDLQKRVDALTLALEQIAYPIPHMQKEAELNGCELNGYWAVKMSEDHTYSKDIARRALEKEQALKGCKE